MARLRVSPASFSAADRGLTRSMTSMLPAGAGALLLDVRARRATDTVLRRRSRATPSWLAEAR